MDIQEIENQPAYSETMKLYHHSEKSKSGILKFRLRESPTDTKNFFHDMVNNLSKKKFGIPVRNLFFTYHFPQGSSSIYHLRTIPLGNNVKYFYHPDVTDLTSVLVYFIEYGTFDNFIDDISHKYDITSPSYEIVEIFLNAIDVHDGAGEVLRFMKKELVAHAGDSDDLANVLLGYVIRFIRSYVDGIIEVHNIEDIPKGVKSEIMIYAPDDIYLGREDS